MKYVMYDGPDSDVRLIVFPAYEQLLYVDYHFILFLDVRLEKSLSKYYLAFTWPSQINKKKMLLYHIAV